MDERCRDYNIKIKRQKTFLLIIILLYISFYYYVVLLFCCVNRFWNSFCHALFVLRVLFLYILFCLKSDWCSADARKEEKKQHFNVGSFSFFIFF